MRGTPLNRITILLTALLTVFALASQSQTRTLDTSHAAKPPEQTRTFFPHNWIRGYTDFAVAPSHNEPDLGRCMFPQPVTAGGTTSNCTAYARYVFCGYIELLPLVRTKACHFYMFLDTVFRFMMYILI